MVIDISSFLLSILMKFRLKCRVFRGMICFRSDRVKTWTIIGSTFGALFGIIGAWVANEVRMRKMKELIPDSALLTPLVKKMTALVEKQQNEVGIKLQLSRIPRFLSNDNSY